MSFLKEKIETSSMGKNENGNFWQKIENGFKPWFDTIYKRI